LLFVDPGSYSEAGSSFRQKSSNLGERRELVVCYTGALTTVGGAMLTILRPLSIPGFTVYQDDGNELNATPKKVVGFYVLPNHAVKSFIFTADNSQPQPWHYSSGATPGPRSYAITVTYFGGDGTQLNAPPVQVTDPVYVIPPPT